MRPMKPHKTQMWRSRPDQQFEVKAINGQFLAHPATAEGRASLKARHYREPTRRAAMALDPNDGPEYGAHACHSWLIGRYPPNRMGRRLLRPEQIHGR